MTDGKLDCTTVAETYLALLKARGIDWLFANAGTDFAPIIEALVRGVIDDIVSPYGIEAIVDYRRGVPPVFNDPESTRILGRAIDHTLGPEGRVATTQSLGGEDFGWYLDRAPGAMARLGTRTPGGPTYDLHQGNLRIDEAATGIGARVLAEAAVTALSAR